ncbi:MAG: serine hydrolase [Anaerolineae bacterium]|nr:serine hydrolase [Anaerolineae bacterium]
MTYAELPASTPEAQGIPSHAILDFVNAAEADVDALHSFILLRHGHRVAQGWWAPYSPDIPHVLFSLSKSFTSTGIGLAVADGLLSVDDPVISFFPEDLPAEVSDNLAAMRVRHLLSMSTGHGEDTTNHMATAPDGNWARAFLARPVDHAPGTHFLYNTGASYMLSAIVQNLTGMTLLLYLTERIFEPLGIEGATWDSCPRGVNLGGFGLSLKTEDIARFGQLYLQKGVWEGEQLLPEAWVAEATSYQTDNSSMDNADWSQGYGFQFWRCRHNAYRGDGAFGQYCLVMPDQDAVLSITGGLGDMQAVLDLVWMHLLPVMAAEALPEDELTRSELVSKLASLALPPLEGLSASPVASAISGKTYAFDLDVQRTIAERHFASADAQLLRSMSLALDGDGGTLVIEDGRGPQKVAFGLREWRFGTTLLDGDKPRKVAASGAWITEDTFAVKLCLYETPFCPTIFCRFGDGHVIYQFRSNVGFGVLERPELVGKVML